MNIIDFCLYRERTSRKIKTQMRFGFKELLIQASEYFIRFAFTAWQLTVKPGRACGKYIDGYRNFLYNPIEYLLLIGGLLIVFNFRYHFFENSYTGLKMHFTFFPEYNDFLISFFDYVEKYATLANIVGIPVFSIVSYALFVDKEFNFAEVLIMNTYIASQQMLFLLLFIPILEFCPSLKTEYLMPIYGFLIIAYNIWSLVDFFNGSIISSTFNAVFAVLLSYVLQFPFNLLIYYLSEPYLNNRVF